MLEAAGNADNYTEWSLKNPLQESEKETIQNFVRGFLGGEAILFRKNPSLVVLQGVKCLTTDRIESLKTGLLGIEGLSASLQEKIKALGQKDTLQGKVLNSVSHLRDYQGQLTEQIVSILKELDVGELEGWKRNSSISALMPKDLISAVIAWKKIQKMPIGIESVGNLILNDLRQYFLEILENQELDTLFTEDGSIYLAEALDKNYIEREDYFEAILIFLERLRPEGEMESRKSKDLAKALAGAWNRLRLQNPEIEARILNIKY